jgi:hypothetical protein
MSLASQMAQRIQPYKQHLLHSMREGKLLNIYDTSCNDIFDLLYSEPFASIHMTKPEYKPERQMVILIDALDEMR